MVGNAISRGNAELEAVLDRGIRYALAAGDDPRSMAVGRAVDRDRRHARQDHDDGADRMAADRGRRRSDGADRRHRAELRRRRRQLPRRQGQGVRHRRRRVRQRLLRQDGEVPEVSAGHRGHQQHRVRSRRHLRGPRRSAARVPAARQPGAAQRPDAARHRQPGCGGAGRARAQPRADVRPVRRRRVAGHRYSSSAAAPRSA